MISRDENVQALRPFIDFGELPQPLNKFQEVLRQILKLQNDILVQNTLHFLKNKHKGFSNLDVNLKKELFLKSLKKDIAFKKDLIGMVKGLFTTDELMEYLNNQQEINKRLVEFIYKRVSTQIC